MMGWSTLPISPEKTITRVSPPSCAVTRMLAEPSRWPASMNSAVTPSHSCTVSPYSHV